MHYFRHSLGLWGQNGEKTNIVSVLLDLIIWWGRQTLIKIKNHGNVKIQLLRGKVLVEGVGRCCPGLDGPLGWICVVGGRHCLQLGDLRLGQQWVQIRAGVVVAWAAAGDSPRCPKTWETWAFVREEQLGRALLGSKGDFLLSSQ